jgi:hypothetical protein
MKKLYLILTAMFLTGCTGAPVKKDVSVPFIPTLNPLEKKVEASNKHPLEKEKKIKTPKKNQFVEKLEYISDYFDRKNTNYYDFESKTSTYRLIRDHIDNDSINDYVLFINKRKNHSSGVNSVYIEDKSESSGLGTVDRVSIRVEIEGVEKTMHFDTNGYLKILTKYANLMRTDHKNEKVKELGYQLRDYQKQIRDAGLIYSSVISNGKDLIVKNELTYLTIKVLSSIIELNNPFKFKFF